MTILWSAAAQTDLGRLYEFMADVHPQAADKMLDRLIVAPEELLPFPRRGPRLSEFNPREVREHRVARYLFRYELNGTNIFVLRIFHAREDRTR